MTASDDWHHEFNLEVRATALSPTLANHPLKIDARTAVIIHWMLVHGDFRPLAESLDEGPPTSLHPAIGRALLFLITKDRLKVLPDDKGAPQLPFGRTARMFLAYREALASFNSEDAIKTVAAAFNRGLETVRQAATEWRKRLGSGPK